MIVIARPTIEGYSGPPLRLFSGLPTGHLPWHCVSSCFIGIDHLSRGDLTGIRKYISPLTLNAESMEYMRLLVCVHPTALWAITRIVRGEEDS